MSKWQPTVAPLRGIIVPMVTPLADADALDHPGLERLVDRLVRGGVHGLFLLGTCGEGPSLSSRLRGELIERVCRQTDGRTPVLVAITDSSPVDSVALARRAADSGADAVVMAPPFYFPLQESELAGLVERVASESPLPVILYNMPALTKVSFDIETVDRLVDNPRVVGLKDSSGDMEHFRRLYDVTRRRSDWSLLIGPEHLLPEAIDLGAHGGVTGGANVWPELFVRIYEAARAGFVDELATLRSNAARFAHLYTIGPFSAASVVKGLKTALGQLSVCSPLMSPPLTALSPVESAEIEHLLASLGLTRPIDPAIAAQQ